jgi:hypothetical protein
MRTKTKPKQRKIGQKSNRTDGCHILPKAQRVLSEQIEILENSFNINGTNM